MNYICVYDQVSIFVLNSIFSNNMACCVFRFGYFQCHNFAVHGHYYSPTHIYVLENSYILLVQLTYVTIPLLLLLDSQSDDPVSNSGSKIRAVIIRSDRCRASDGVVYELSGG